MNEPLIEQLLRKGVKQIPSSLPNEYHLEAFAKKIQDSKRTKRKLKSILVAACISFVLIVSTLYYPSEQEDTQVNILATFYQEQIQQQLYFIEQSNDSEFKNIIDDTKLQLDQLNAEFMHLEENLDTKGNHPLLINAMIKNLETQIILLNDLNQKIKSLKHPTL